MYTYLITESALAGKLELFAHLSAELVDVRGWWHKVIIQVQVNGLKAFWNWGNKFGRLDSRFG